MYALRTWKSTRRNVCKWHNRVNDIIVFTAGFGTGKLGHSEANLEIKRSTFIIPNTSEFSSA